MIDSCEKTLSHTKHCSFLRISGQSLSLLYQDVCPTIRPITFDFLFELQSRRENSSGGIAIPSSGWRVREGNGLGAGHFTTTTSGSMWLKKMGAEVTTRKSGPQKPCCAGRNGFAWRECKAMQWLRAQPLDSLNPDSMGLLLAVRGLG